MKFELFEGVLAQLNPHVIDKPTQHNIRQLLNSVDLNPVSTYLECRLDDTDAIDITNCYSLQTTLNATQKVPQGASNTLQKAATLPLAYQPKWFWLEYDNCH